MIFNDMEMPKTYDKIEKPFNLKTVAISLLNTGIGFIFQALFTTLRFVTLKNVFSRYFS